MKLILIGLLLLNLTAYLPAYTQTKDTNGEVYCLSISKARLLIADALRLRVADSLNNLQSSRIALLESQYESSYSSFTNLLNIEQNKLQLQKEITDHQKEVSKSYKEENQHLKKKVNRITLKSIGLAFLALVEAAIIIAVTF